MKAIKFDRVTSIVGTTEHGKSYFTKRILAVQDIGVLYFNMLCDNKDCKGFVGVNAKADIKDIFNALDKGKKLNYNPSIYKEIAEMELLYLIQEFMRRSNWKWFVFAIEEIHLITNKELLKAIEGTAFAGRHRGIRPVYITQRPQSLPRGCITQTTQLIMFNMGFEDNWLKNYKLDAETMRKEIAGRKFYYCRYTPSLGLEKATKL